MTTYPKRLIEVDLPIKRISAHARREKSIRHGHISTLHIWWARRPLAACRAVICAALWPDPADPLCPDSFRDKARSLMLKWAKDHLDLLSADSSRRFVGFQKNPRKLNDGEELRGALLDFIADFANWDNSTRKEYLDTARALTQAAHEALGGAPGTRPLVVDPFAGGGAIPLEALRIGADAFASDLNPVAVLLNKVVLEYIPKYGQRLADEVRKWGEWIKKEAEKELAEFYPKDPDGATPIAYLWARTITCEGPGCGAEVPLMRSLWLAKKGGRSVALRMRPSPPTPLPRGEGSITFEIIENAKPKDVREGTVRRGSVTCPVCGFTTPVSSVRQQMKARRGGASDARLFCVVTTHPGEQGRFYRLPTKRDLEAIQKATEELERRKRRHRGPLSLAPDEPTPQGGGSGAGRAFSQRNYGMDRFEDLFNPRQALALTTLARLVRECPLTPLPPLPEGEGGPSPPPPLPEGEGRDGEAISFVAGRNRQIPEVLLQRARELRQQQTPAEEVLWACLRNRQLFGVKFRRQHNVGRYIADFYCHEARLIIEADGGVHEGRKEDDAIRDEWAYANGFTVLRFKNEEILCNTECVLNTIVKAITPSPPSPLPRGEGSIVNRRASNSPLPSGEGTGVRAGLAQAVQTCLALAVDKVADFNSSLARWAVPRETSAATFGRQALPMLWDFCETCPCGGGMGSFLSAISWVAACFAQGSLDHPGNVERASATAHPLPDDAGDAFITDPPYYDAVPYADLSDFFYVWLKRSLVPPISLAFKDPLSPKAEECVVDEVKGHDRSFFEHTMGQAMAEGRRVINPDGVGIVVFAHKSTSGWEAQLQAMIDAGWTMTGSWPIDTERAVRMRAQSSAALASSVHLVCRPREIPPLPQGEGTGVRASPPAELIGDWRDVLRELPRRIHEWMPRLASEGVVGADAIFACLGPALEIFSRYARVEKASGEHVTLKEYLEHVWAAVAREALNMIFEGADATGFEEDARLTAMWLWTLSTSRKGNRNGEAAAEEAEGEDEEESRAARTTGYTLEFDAARKIAQGLGAHLERLSHLVEIKGETARLLPVSERTSYLFGKDEAEAPTGRRKKKDPQLKLGFAQEPEQAEEEGGWGQKNAPRPGSTALDRVHQAMILFAAGRSEAMKRFLVEEGAGRDARFWRLAQALSALYPLSTDEKRWVDGVLARKKGVGF